MSINEIVIYIMVFFMIIGAIDKMLSNKFKLGDKFEEGIMAMGSLAMAMVGIIVMAPILAKILSPVVVPLYSVLGSDPAMFAGSLLAIDMGGLPLAQELALNDDIAMFSGIILGSMMGATIVFSIPVSLGIIKKEDQRYLAIGMLAGFIAIPVGSIVGGLVAGYSFNMVIINLIPIYILAGLIIIGLWKFPDKMIRGFTIFGHGVVIVAVFGLAVGIVDVLTGYTIIPGIGSLTEGIEIVGSIAIVLAGAFVFVEVVTRVFSKPLMKVGKALGMNDVSAAGLIATLANNIAMFNLMKDMDKRGKIINVAFSVPAAFVLGDHLGFAAGVARDMIFPMVTGKFAGGIFAIFVAMFIASRILKSESTEEKKVG